MVENKETITKLKDQIAQMLEEVEANCSVSKDTACTIQTTTWFQAEIRKMMLNRVEGQLQISEATVQHCHRQMEMSTDEVVQEMENKMSTSQVEYFRY